jgi:hypothetical protein
MAWWVHKRGGFGTKASAVLRSLYPIIIGLGGWLLGTLIVLAILPSVPIDSDPVVALFVAVPVGLGICLAWVRRDWSAQRKGVGLAAAIAGAVAGAWARVPCHHWPDSTGHRAPRSRCRQPRADPARHGRASSADDRISADRAPDTRSASAKPETPTGAGVR